MARVRKEWASVQPTQIGLSTFLWTCNPTPIDSNPHKDADKFIIYRYSSGIILHSIFFLGGGCRFSFQFNLFGCGSKHCTPSEPQGWWSSLKNHMISRFWPIPLSQQNSTGFLQSDLWTFFSKALFWWPCPPATGRWLSWWCSAWLRWEGRWIAPRCLETDDSTMISPWRPWKKLIKQGDGIEMYPLVI